MRFSFASVALLALAHLLAPGVYGAPAVVSDHTNSLAVRQVPSSLNIVDALLDAIRGLLGNTSGNPASAIPISPELAQLAQQLAQQITQELQTRTVGGMLARGPSSSESTSPTTLLPTTTSRALPVSTDRIGESTVSSVSTPQASSTPQTRIRRQLPSGLPSSIPSGIVGSQSTALPVQSILASVLSVVSSKFVASQPAVSKPTPSKH